MRSFLNYSNHFRNVTTAQPDELNVLNRVRDPQLKPKNLIFFKSCSLQQFPSRTENLLQLYGKRNFQIVQSSMLLLFT